METTKLVSASSRFDMDQGHCNNVFVSKNTTKYDENEATCVGNDVISNDNVHSFEMTASCETMDSSENTSLIGKKLDDQTQGHVGKITNCQALLHVIKCHTAAALLGAPRAVENAGLWTGLVLCVVCGLLVLSGMHLLLTCARHVGNRLSTDHSLWTYQDIVEICLQNGAHKTRRLAGFGRNLAIGLSTLLQFGTCSVYFVVVGDSVKQVTHQVYSNDPDIRVYMVAMLVVLLPFSQLKRLDIMAVFSAIAIALFLASLVIAVGYIVTSLPPPSTRPAFNSWVTLPLAIGQLLMAMEGIATIIPLQNKMKHPEAFVGWTGVLNKGLGFVIFLNAFLGFLGYLRFGDGTATNILLNLPADQWLFIAAKLMVDVSIILTYTLQFYVIFTMTWYPFERYITTPWLLAYGEHIQRLIMLILTFACAVLVPHLDLLIALFGSICGTFLGFLIPAFIHIITFTSDGQSISKVDVFRDILFIVVGLFCFLSGSYFALKDIVATF